MKKIYHFYHELASNQVFIDQDARFVSQMWVHPDDPSNLDFEALQRTFQHVGSDLVELNGADCLPDDPDDDLEENFGYDDEEIREWVERKPIQKMLKEAIRSADAELAAPAESAEEEEFAEVEVVNHIGPLVQKLEEEEEKQKEQEEKMTTKKKTPTTKSSAPKKTTASKKHAKAKTSKAKKPAKKPAAKPSKKPAKGGGKKK